MFEKLKQIRNKVRNKVFDPEPGINVMDAIKGIILIVIGYIIFDTMTGTSGLIVLPQTLQIAFTIAFVILAFILVISLLPGGKKR